jgi:2-hydroxychromene-2-carboxylate isomerase
VEFWYEFASTYSYLSVLRIEEAASEAGVPVLWRPFLLGPIFAAQGWSDSPFNIYKAKGEHMWRDLERRAEGYGLPFRRPSAFPRNGLLAARVALVAEREGWCGDFSRAVFRANFVVDRDVGDREVISDIVGTLGRDPQTILCRAGDAANKAGLRERTNAAQRNGIFGAPSFLVGGELFWGDDRLEDALAWARSSVGAQLESASS